MKRKKKINKTPLFTKATKTFKEGRKQTPGTANPSRIRDVKSIFPETTRKMK